MANNLKENIDYKIDKYVVKFQNVIDDFEKLNRNFLLFLKKKKI